METLQARLEPKSENKIAAYFQRAGVLGHIVVMVAFYLLVFTGLIMIL